MQIEISQLHEGQGAACNQVLRSLPKWFGIEDAIVQYVHDVEGMLMYVATFDGEAVGIISIHLHNEWTAEVHVLAVREPCHRHGIGSQLLAQAEMKLRDLEIEYLAVKTLSPSKENAEYEKTRRFYFARGFRPLEEFKTLWGPANPCWFMVKRLRN